MTKERIYVKVTSVTDTTGHVNPSNIIWEDGRTFNIDRVRAHRPASIVGLSMDGDCYTVVIGNQEKLLFYERTSIFSVNTGRWFVFKNAFESSPDLLNCECS